MQITKELLIEHNLSPEDILFYSSTRIIGMSVADIHALKFQKNSALMHVNNAYYSLLDYYIDLIKAVVKAHNRGQRRFDSVQKEKEQFQYSTEYIEIISNSYPNTPKFEKCTYKKFNCNITKICTYDKFGREVNQCIRRSGEGYDNTITFNRDSTYLNEVLLSVVDNSGIYTFVYSSDYKKLLNILYQSTIIM